MYQTKEKIMTLQDDFRRRYTDMRVSTIDGNGSIMVLVHELLNPPRAQVRLDSGIDRWYWADKIELIGE